MRFLVTGATGFLGGRIVSKFSEYEVVSSILATGRCLKPNTKEINPKVEYLLGDLCNSDFVQTLFTNRIDVVINCASLSSPWGALKDFEDANVKSQQNLIEQCLRSQVDRFIYISTPSIYFNFRDAINLSETSPLPDKMVNYYAETKLLAEHMLEKSGLRFITLRPRALIGAGDTVIMPRLIRSYKLGRLRIMGTGNNLVDLTPVSNVVDAVWKSVRASDDCCNTSYNISNGHPVNLWESINKVLIAIHLKPVEDRISYRFLLFIATLMEWKAKILGGFREPVLTRYTVGVMSKSFYMDITKARTKLGYEPQQTVDEAIAEFANWYQTHLDE